MLKKKQISQNTFRFFSFISTGIVILAVNIFLSNFGISKIRQISNRQYTESLDQVIDGFANTIAQKVYNYEVLLKAYNPELLQEGTPEEIQAYLVKNAWKTPEYFSSVYFCTMDGRSWTQDNRIIQTYPDDSFLEKLQSLEFTFVTDTYVSVQTNKPSISFCRRVVDKKGNLKGAICASMLLTTLHKELSDISIGDHQRIVIQNSKDVVIYHPQRKFLNTLAHHNITKSLKDPEPADWTKATEGFLQTTNTDGVPVCVFFRTIKYTDWYVGLVIDLDEYEMVLNTQRKYELLIILFTSLTVIFLIFLEYKLSEYFRRIEFFSTIYDPLTNLYTRPQFEAYASKLLNRNPKSKFMLIEADIHGFKFINQNFGIEKADKLITFFGKKLADFSILKKGIICRGYADRFYAIMKIKSSRSALKDFQTCINDLNNSIKDYEIQFFPKYGITFRQPEDSADEKPISIQELIGQASFAKSTIKDNILNSYAIFDQELLQKSNEEHYLENHMEQAMKDGEFYVVYQPKINLLNDKIVGAEALVRWNNPKLGQLSPARFIPLFERNDSVKELDFYVYEQVFKFLRQSLDNGVDVVPVSLNMSRNHSNPEVFIQRFTETFKKYNLPSSLIEVEILERSVMDRNTLKITTEMLHKEGFKVAMDDFGSGESSLNMLTKIPVDSLKFDKSFLDEASKNNQENLDKDATALIETLVEMGRNLKKQTIFEGVETEVQRNFLRTINCDLVQGYFYSKPLSEEEFLAFLLSHK